MKTYLPYCCKKVGIIIVIMAIIISFMANANEIERGYIKGYNSASSLDRSINTEEVPLTYQEVISPKLADTLNWISILMSFSGFLMYIFSKEKIEDELIQKLRYQSLEKSLLITWLIAMLFFIFRQVAFEAFYILQIQLLAYVFIFHHYKVKFLVN